MLAKYVEKLDRPGYDFGLMTQTAPERDERLRHDRGGDRGHPPGQVRGRRRRGRPRERGRPDDRGPVRDARGDQLHGHARARPDLPLPDRGALRRAGSPPDGRAERGAAPDRLHRLDRGARRRHDRHLRAGPLAHDPGRDRPDEGPASTSSSPATSSRCARANGGVLVRAGQTEAAVDLARLAGLNPAGVVCEVMKEDGTMARVPDLVQYCERHGIKLITVADLIEYRRRTEKLVERTTSVRLPTAYGEFTGDRVPREADRASTTSRSSAARSTAPRTCSSASTPSA